MPVSVLSTCLHVFWRPQIEELICIKFCRRRSSYRNLWNRLQHPWFMISKKSVIINMTNIITHFDVPCTPSCKHESYIDSFNSYNSSFIGILIFPSFLMRCCHPDKLLKIIQLVSGGDNIQWFAFVKLKFKHQTCLCMAQLWTHLGHKAFSVSWTYIVLWLFLQSWRLAHSSRV